MINNYNRHSGSNASNDKNNRPRRPGPRPLAARPGTSVGPKVSGPRLNGVPPARPNGQPFPPRSAPNRPTGSRPAFAYGSRPASNEGNRSSQSFRGPGSRASKRPFNRSDRSGFTFSKKAEEKMLVPGSTDPGEEGNDERPVTKKIPPVAPGDIRIIPLGGVEEIGKNMTAIEIDNDIIVVDIGFAFPGGDAPGVDYIIPDSSYLEQRKERIRGVIITHAHLDHIGGIPYVMPKIGNPPIYTSLLTAVMIKKRQEEFPHLPKLNIQVVEDKDSLRLGDLKIRFFPTTHTIPDSLGVIVETAYGNIVLTGDIKVEHKDGLPVKEELETFTKLGKEKNLLLISDSTNVEKPGFSYAEKDVHDNVKKIIADVKGRIIIGVFASLFERIVAIVMACEDLGKKVAIEGRSMKSNIEIAKELGILKVKKGTLINTDEIDQFPENKVVILATGAQGDEYAALMRISQKEHNLVKLKKGDTVLLSASVIPGNEKAVQKLKDNLSRLGARIIHYGIANVHSSGHSYAGEIAWLHKMIKPKFFIPVHGHHHMLRIHAQLAMDMGLPEKNIVVPDNGSIIDITEGGTKITTLKMPASAGTVVMVDGLGANDVKEVVLRDRQLLSQDGMFVLVAIIDLKTGKVRKSPDIISRGFIYLKESQDILRHVRLVTKKTIEDATTQMHPINFDYVKNMVREEVGKYLFQKTHKRPIVLPVLIEV